MNYCKIFLCSRSKPLASNYRSYSIACNTVLERRHSCSYREEKCLFKQPILSPTYTYQNRNMSIDGIVKWQEQTYNSIANSSPVNIMQDGLLYFHDTTGLTWSVTIIATTLIIRTLMTLPLTIYQNSILAKVENIGLELKDMVNEMKKETAMARKMFNLNDKQTVLLFQRSMKKQWRNLIERDNCHPLKATIVVWFQIPIWVCMSFALRNLVTMHRLDPSALVTFMELEVGGFGWIPNLTEADHSLILPVMFGLTNLAIIEIQRMSKLREPSRMYNIFTNGFRVFSIVMIPIAASVPSCMCLYWTTSSLFGLAQNLCLLSPSLRRKLKIPEAPSELEDPYGHMKQEISVRIRKTPIIASIYTSGRDEQNFSKPEMFLPYRWDRNDSRRKSLVNHTPSASLPFAMGARSCIGKKIAQVQLTELVTQVTENFDIKCKNSKDVKSMTSQVLVPDRQLEFVISVRDRDGS